MVGYFYSYYLPQTPGYMAASIILAMITSFLCCAWGGICFLHNMNDRAHIRRSKVPDYVGVNIQLVVSLAMPLVIGGVGLYPTFGFAALIFILLSLSAGGSFVWLRYRKELSGE